MYQSKQGDVDRSVSGSYKDPGQKMKIVEGNASVCQEHPECRITGEGRAEVLRAWEPGYKQERARHQGELGEGRLPTASGRIAVRACYAGSARSRRWCRRVGRQGRWGAGGGMNWSSSAWIARKVMR